MRSSLLRASALAVAVLVTVSGCAEKPETGLAIQSVRADIVFGAKAPPANIAPPAEPLEPLTGEEFPAPTERRVRPLTFPSPAACPSAGRTEAVSEQAPDNARPPAPEGSYRWKYQSVQELTVPKGFKSTTNGFERRTVTMNQRISETEFRFKVSQIELGSGDIVATTYKVKRDPTEARAPQTTTRVGEPDRGVTIERIERLDPRTGNEKGRFSPNPAVLILPLPVLPAESFQAVGVDPMTRERLSVNGTVQKRELVDACGDLIDGWMVESTQTFTNSAGTDQARKFVAIFATQWGGLPISESIETENANGKLNLHHSIGQAKPSPIP